MTHHKNAPEGAYPRAARRNPLEECPLTATLAAVGGKWKLTLIYWLAHEEHHFSGLLRRAAPISHKVLTEQLRELETDGLVEREETGPVPTPVRYHLTEYGRTALPLVECARVWGLQHLERRGGRRTPGTSALSCSNVTATGGVLD
ncbi:transcriptional regulator [Corallococcus sp. H22C18031201]|nr:transcriptional regulator [Corallococcus sp. H22C18031201]